MNEVDEVFRGRRTNDFYYNNYFHFQEVREEAINNIANIRLGFDLLNQLDKDIIREYFQYHPYYDIELIVMLNADRVIKYGNITIEDDTPLYIAAEYDSLETLKYLRGLNIDRSDLTIIDTAIQNGSVRVLKWLNDKFIFGLYEPNILEEGIMYYQFDLVKLLVDNNVKVHPKNIYHLHFEFEEEVQILRYLIFHGGVDISKIDKYIAKRILFSGDLEVIEFIYSPKLYDEESVITAALGKQFEVADFLAEKMDRDKLIEYIRTYLKSDMYRTLYLYAEIDKDVIEYLKELAHVS